MFRALGFDPEALLTDHVRDRSGALRDLMILAQSVEAQWSAHVRRRHLGRAVNAARRRGSRGRRQRLRGHDPPVLRPPARARAHAGGSICSIRRPTSRGTSPRCRCRPPAGCWTHEHAALGEHRYGRPRAHDHGPGTERRRLVAHRPGAVSLVAGHHVRQPRGGAVAGAPAQLHHRGDGRRRRLGARRGRRRARPRVRLLARRHGRAAAGAAPRGARALARPGSDASGRAARGAAERRRDRVLPPPGDDVGRGRRPRLGAVQLRAALPTRAQGPHRRGHPAPAGPSVPRSRPTGRRSWPRRCTTATGG